MQANFWELILEHLEEHGKKMINSSVSRSASWNHGLGLSTDVLLLAQDWSKSTDLSAQSRANMLRAVRHKVFDAAHSLVEKGCSLNQSTESRDLSRDSRPHLSLVVLEQLYECGDQVSRYDLLVDCFRNLYDASANHLLSNQSDTYLLKPISNHVPNPPALVLYQAS